MSLSTNLVSYWKLDESSGNASDSVGSNTLTNNGTMTYGAGKINNGAITASGKYLNSSTPASTATTNFSVAMWVNLSSTSLSGAFCHNGNGSLNNGWGIGVGNVQYDGAGGTGNNLILLVDSIAWRAFGSFGGSGMHHVVVTRGTTTWKAYIDGKLMASTFTDTPSAPSGNLDVGRDVGQTAPFAGTLDEIGFWTRELTYAEVSQLWNGGAGSQYPFSTVSQSFNQSGAISTSTGTAATQSITAVTTTGAVMFIAVRSNTGTNAPVSADYGGVAGTFIGSATTVGNGGASGGAFIFINPPTGTQTLTINSGGSESWVGVYGFYDNFKTSGQPDNTNLTTGNTTATPTKSLTPNADNCWIIYLSGGADVTPTAGAGVTLRSTGGQGMIGDTNGPIHPAASTSMTATVTSTRTSYVYLVSIAPPIAGGTSFSSTMLLMGV